MSKPSLFLETTIQIERIAGSRLRKAQLRQDLSDYRLVTSNYVYGEYLRTIVKDAIQLHTLIAQHAHIDDVMTAISQHRNRRETNRMILIFGELLRAERVLEEEPYHFSRLRLLDRLSRYIELSLPNLFMAGIDEIIDFTKCGLATERPKINETISDVSTYTLRSQCLRRVRECDLAERLVEWQPELAELSKGLATETDPALVRIRQLIGEIMSDPNIARGRNCTWYLGDLVIALELPSDIHLYTTNIRHFGPLLRILGKKLYSP